jgi:hypothetical protein
VKIKSANCQTCTYLNAQQDPDPPRIVINPSVFIFILNRSDGQPQVHEIGDSIGPKGTGENGQPVTSISLHVERLSLPPQCPKTAAVPQRRRATSWDAETINNVFLLSTGWHSTRLERTVKTKQPENDPSTDGIDGSRPMAAPINKHPNQNKRQRWLF